MSISIVVPTLISNAKQYKMTLDCLKSLKNTSLDYELIIVETLTDYLLDECNVYIHEKEKTNATKSINRGLKVANGDYVALVTNDVILEPNWLDCLLDCFKLKDCGLATLATPQLGHYKEDRIKEGIWFSVAMMPKRMAMFDENYVNSWDDSDIIMRTYLDGKKMYRNYNSLVSHDPGQTQYTNSNHEANFIKNKAYFMDKYKDHKDHRMYKILTEGWVI